MESSSRSTENERTCISGVSSWLVFEGKESESDHLQAVKKSNVLIPVLSQNYASSRCCLGELLEMMECKISRGHLVLPILYKVEPEDVELLLVMLAKRFCLREKHVDEKVEDQWEEVLIEIRSLKGWDSKKDVNRYCFTRTFLTFRALTICISISNIYNIEVRN